MIQRKQLRVLLSILLLGAMTVHSAYGGERERAATVDPGAILEKARIEHDTSSSLVVPDMDGYLVKMPGSYALYVIMDGKRRRIQSPEVQNRVFQRTCSFYESPFVSLIDLDADFADAHLIAANPSGALYLFVDGQLRHIASPATVGKYCFDPGKSVAIPDVVLASIPRGRILW